MGMKPRAPRANLRHPPAYSFTPAPKKLRTRTWTTEGWNGKEALAATVADFAQSVLVAPSSKTIHFGAAFAAKPEEIDGPAVKQRITLTIEDIE